MSIEWEEALETGVDEMDDRYRDFFWEFYTFSRKIEEGKEEEGVERIIDFLDKRTRELFEYEESLYKNAELPGTAEHLAEHVRILKEVSSFRFQLESYGISKPLALQLKGKLVRWMITHIKGEDKLFLSQIKARSTVANDEIVDELKLGETLILQNVITRITLQKALALQGEKGLSLTNILKKMGVVNDRELFEAQAAVRGMMSGNNVVV